MPHPDPERARVWAYATMQTHTIDASEPLSAARDLMEAHGIRHLPVVESGELWGILSDRDVKLAQAFSKVLGNIPVRDVCTTEVYVTQADTLVSEGARILADRRLGCAVLTRDQEVVGIFTTTDACRALAELLSGE